LQNNTFSTLFIGQNLIKLKEVDSTNNFLKNLASKSEPLADGTVIMAEDQYAGRGQRQNVWHSEPGKNLITSIYLKPSFLNANKQFYLNMAVSLALKDTFNLFIGDIVKIKWPNDIYFQNKKIAGILIENTLTGLVIRSTVIGLGLNINQDIFDKSVENKAISIKNITKKITDLDAVVVALCSFLEKYYMQLRAGNYSFLHKNYLNSLFLYQQSFAYRFNGNIFEGIITNVDELGRLVVITNGIEQRFNFKEIEFLLNKE
jgi:BirA family biotin operon repressor/biotin-[acetyl-CoA-carboxylase] ligase